MSNYIRHNLCNRLEVFFLIFFIFILLFVHYNLIFAEEKSSLELEPIVISKSDIHLKKIYSLDFAAIEGLPFTTPLEALSILPLDLQSRALKKDIQTDFSIRGSTFQGVLVLIDGQRINDPQTGHHHSDIPLTKEDIERIEVIPGANSSIFGPDAIGGTINIITKKPKEKKIVLELGYGSHKLKTGTFSINEKINNLATGFSLERQESDGFYYDTDFKKFTTSLNSFLDIPDGEFHLKLGYQEKEFGAYDFYTPASGYPSKEWTKTYLLNSGIDLEKQGFLIKPNFLWRRHYDKFMLDKTQKRSTYLNHHRTDVYTPNIYLQKETNLLGRVGLGLEYGKERINSTNLGKHQRNHKSIFMDEGKDLTDKLSLGLSWRLDDFDGFDRVYTGALNSRYKLSGADTLHLGISESMRLPSFTELYYNDPTTLGNIHLSAEKALNYEIGYDYQKEKLSVGTSLFLREEKDFIDWIKRSHTQTKWQVENISEAEVFGIENYLRLEISQNLKLDSNYTYINKRINDQGHIYKYGPNYVRHILNSVFSLSLPFGVNTLGLTYKKKPRRDGWVILNSHFSYHLNKNSQIFVDITNLLNSEYQEIEGIPQPGRWVEAGIRLEW